jgi:carbon monoxide dehydrogenase subunit G
MSSISFTTNITIGRPIDDVFARLEDPAGFPAWNSAVERVEARGDGRYVMHRRLPSGPAVNELGVIERHPPTTFAVRTTSGPTPFVYRYALEPTDDGTLVTLQAEADVPGPAVLVKHAVKRGVDANLATLKAILEKR